MDRTAPANLDYRALCIAVESKGWDLEVVVGDLDLPRVVVVTDGDSSNYSRDVQPGESFNRCAQVILQGLRRSKVL